MSSGIDGGLLVFVPSVIRSSTLLGTSMRVYHCIGRRIPRVCKGLDSLAPGEAFYPSPRDEFSIGFRQVGDVSEAKFCKSFLAAVDLFGIGVAFRVPMADFWLGCPGVFARSLFECVCLRVECGGSPLAG